MRRITLNPARVFDFVSRRVPLTLTAGIQGIGLERDGELVAGVVYEGFNGRNIWMHCAGTVGTNWMTRGYLRACFRYPFVQCGVDRISAFVMADNRAARKLNEHLGFTQEAVLRGAAPDGGDVLIYAMRREECRYV